MRRLLTFVLLPLALTALAQETQEAPATPTEQEAPAEAAERIIRISGEGIAGSGNPIFGPITYSHPSDPEGVVSQVSNLTIYSQQALLRVPGNADEGAERVSLAKAEGRRVATFEGGVRVTRGRLEAQGPDLVYSEETGLGTMTSGADIVIAPSEEGGDATEIRADEVEFDVDTDISVSRGGVSLVSGNQRAEADELTFAEERDLGRLLCEGGQCTVIRTAEDGSELRITADEIRVLTEEERLWARGAVTVVDGDITSTGAEVFYDDERQLAEILGAEGAPARSVDAGSGSTLEAARIRQDVEFDFVEAIDASEATDFQPEPFLFDEEAAAAAAAG